MALSSRCAPFLAIVYCALAARSVAFMASYCAFASSLFCAVITPSSYRRFTRLYDFSAISSPALAFCHISYAACSCSLLVPLRAFSFSACAACSAACACDNLAITSGASRIASVSPAFTLSPSLTKNFRIRPGTLLDTLYSVASAWPCMISGPFPKVKNPMMLTITITANNVKKASMILLR